MSQRKFQHKRQAKITTVRQMTPSLQKCSNFSVDLHWNVLFDIGSWSCWLILCLNESCLLFIIGLARDSNPHASTAQLLGAHAPDLAALLSSDDVLLWAGGFETMKWTSSSSIASSNISSSSELKLGYNYFIFFNFKFRYGHLQVLGRTQVTQVLSRKLVHSAINYSILKSSNKFRLHLFLKGTFVSLKNPAMNLS